jgi:hypothetical protein
MIRTRRATIGVSHHPGRSIGESNRPDRRSPFSITTADAPDLDVFVVAKRRAEQEVIDVARFCL